MHDEHRRPDELLFHVRAPAPSTRLCKATLAFSLSALLNRRAPAPIRRRRRGPTPVTRTGSTNDAGHPDSGKDSGVTPPVDAGHTTPDAGHTTPDAGPPHDAAAGRARRILPAGRRARRVTLAFGGAIERALRECAYRDDPH